ncbi:uracil-DNA glycosylase family protein [Rhodospirillaceae bacterium SYSU D60014]|uniref:uracil-DNA glycosylase family protein n=1 Tax=Virgifigura deserti TaxID=2268457 RepID=UPI000E6661D8
MSGEPSLTELLRQIRACRLCAEHLPLGPRPVVRANAAAPLLIVGQAPGTRVHESGIPWNDRSGDRLRDWLQLDRATFYDESRVAIVPMGFCYPGVDRNGGDKPPRRECAPLWHEAIRARLPHVALTLLVGQYAQAHYLGAARKSTMTETVRAWRDFLPDFLPLPHPSWRNTAWLKRNPWFAEDLLPDLRRRVGAVLGR